MNDRIIDGSPNPRLRATSRSVNLDSSGTAEASRLAHRCARCLVALLCALISSAAVAQQLEWTRTIGGPDSAPGLAEASRIVSDASGVYVLGKVGTGLGAGAYVFLRKYGFDGQVLWTRQFERGVPYGAMAIDETGLYVAGSDDITDSWLAARLDKQGSVIWSRALDPLANPLSIAVHPSGIYVGGIQSRPRPSGGFDLQAALRKLDRDGNEVWTTLLGTSEEDEEILQVAVDDSGVYVGGKIGNALVRQFDFAGRQLATFGRPEPFSFGGSFAVDASGVYASSLGFVKKFARDGSLLWSLRTDAEPLKADATGLYTSSSTFVPSIPTDPVDKAYQSVTKLTPGGNELWTFRPSMTPRPYHVDIDVRDGQVSFLGTFAVTDPACPSCDYKARLYVGKLSQALPPQLTALHDALVPSELAVLRHDPATSSISAIVRNAATGGLVRRIEFDGAYWPRQLLAMPDANGNGADELVLLGTQRSSGAIAAEVRDGRSGAFITRVNFGNGATSGRLAVLPDINGNGTPELALMQIGRDVGRLRADVRDGITGALLKRTNFNFSYPLAFWFDVVVLADSTGNGVPELAALGENGHGATLETRDAITGDLVGDRFFGGPVLLDAMPLFASLPDGTGNGVGEVALLSIRFGAWRAYVADATPTVDLGPDRLVAFNQVGVPRYLAAMPDVNGNGYPELAVVKSNAFADADQVQIKDALTGAPVRNFNYPSTGFSNRALAAIADLNGNGSAEVVVLQQRKSDDVVRARIHDARTGALIRSIDF